MRKIVVAILIAAIVSIANACMTTPETQDTLIVEDINDIIVTQTTDVTVPEPSPDGSSITGFIQVRGKPLSSEVLYLADIVYVDDDTPFLAGFDRNVNIHTKTNSEGWFVFTNVPPDKMYALILDRFTISVMLKNPADGKDLLFTPSAGKILDLGTLKYDSLLDINED